MTPALAEPLFAPRPTERSGGGLTLEERLSGTWRAALEGAEPACPVCGGTMRAASQAAECTSCGSRLS